MVTVLRAQGYRFVIFANDQLPAHVHAFGDGEAKIDLSGEAPKLLWAVDMKRGDVRRVMAVAREHRGILLERWITIHG